MPTKKQLQRYLENAREAARAVGLTPKQVRKMICGDINRMAGDKRQAERALPYIKEMLKND